MKLKRIKTKKDYREALGRFEEIFQAKPGTPESDEADVLALLIEDYEHRHYVIEVPDPLEAIKYRMEEQGLTNKDLANILGYKSRVTDIFKKHRKLNLNMVRKLHQVLNIPLETLVKDY
ncbi:MAG: helix-turn-helix domain-containing protein [Flavobacteriales bacterium]|nr:helix-turn-helix domain-containing protein [Flavobacteriales bacterium]